MKNFILTCCCTAMTIGQLIVFDQANYAGERVFVDVNTDLTVTGHMNDQISSAKIAPGSVVFFYFRIHTL